MTIYRIPIALTTEAPCLFGNGEPTGNVTASLDFVPGSVLRGWAAWRFIAAGGDPDSQAFRETFLWGGARFLDGRPTLAGKVAAHAPFSLFECKRHPLGAVSTLPTADIAAPGEPHAVADRAFDDDWGDCTSNGCGSGRRRVRGWTTGDELLRVETEMSAHNTIDVESKRPAGAGGVFSLETISAGQQFTGAFVVSADPAEFLTSLGLSSGSAVRARLGRGRSSKGLGEVALVPGVPEEWGVTSPDSSGTTVVDFLSRTIPAAPSGVPINDASGVVDWLRVLLGVASAIPARPFVAFEAVAGYSAATGLPREREVAIAAGSCVAFDVPVADIGADVHERVLRGIGMRTSEGYGEVALNGPGHALSTGGVTS